MSRTFRKRKNESWFGNERYAREQHLSTDELINYDFNEIDTIKPYYFSEYRGEWEYRVLFSRQGKEGRKLLAKFHSDAWTHECKEPGPRYWRNLVVHRPLRRRYKEQCRKALYDDDFEVVIERIVYPYWT